MKKREFRAVGLAAAFCMVIAGIAPASALAASHEGVCQSGEGVTVIVDKTLDGSAPDARCAIGASGTIAEAFEAAGFPIIGFYATSVDGLDASTFGAEGWWMLYTSTVTGAPRGPSSHTWVFATVGAGDGMVSTNQAYLFRPNDSYSTTVPGKSVTPTLSDLGLASTQESGGSASTGGTADAVAAAAWLGAQLAANGDVLILNGKTDWGLTADAIFALASAGVGGEQIKKTAAKLAASDAEFIGTPDTITTSWPYVAKTVLALQVAQGDPSAFAASTGTRDLVAELTDWTLLNFDGSFGSSDNVFHHSLAMLALARTDDGVPGSATAWLVDQQCPDNGSFGTASGCTSPDADYTAVAIQALIAAGTVSTDPALTSAKAWLALQQDASGGFETTLNGVNTNSAGLVAQTLPENLDLVEAATGYIGGLEVTCATIEANPLLALSDLGAIAPNQAEFAALDEYGLDEVATATFLRATTQAILGLGGSGFATLSAADADPQLPEPNCTPPTPPVLEEEPAGAPVPSGGSVHPGSAGMIGLIALGVLVGVLSRRALALR